MDAPCWMHAPVRKSKDLTIPVMNSCKGNSSPDLVLLSYESNAAVDETLGAPVESAAAAELRVVTHVNCIWNIRPSPQQSPAEINAWCREQ